MPNYGENPYAGFGTSGDYYQNNPWSWMTDVSPTDQPMDDPNWQGYQNNTVGTTDATTAPQYGDNPYWGPLNAPGGTQIGDPSMQVGNNYPGVLGGVDANGISIADNGQYNPANDPAVTGHGSLGANNPTAYGQPGGIFGSGIDVGIPGIASIGGIGQTVGLGGLLGMDQPGMGLGGSIGVDTGGSGGMLGLGNGGGLLGLGGGALLGGLALGAGTSGNAGMNSPQQTAPTDAAPATVIPPVATGPSSNTAPSNSVIDGGAPAVNTTTLPPVTGLGTGPAQSNPATTVLPPIGNTNSSIDGNNPGNAATTIPLPNIGGMTTGGTQNGGGSTTIPVVPGTGPVTGGGGTQTGPSSTVPVIPAVIGGAVGGVIGGSTGGTPVNNTTMPTLPTDRNLFREGTQTNTDLTSILQGIFGNYAGQSGQYGQQDLNNFGSLLGGVLGNNGSLTNAANAQTASGNTALRTGNVGDASTLGPQALSLLQQLNPNMYGALNSANTSAGASGPSDIQMTLEQQARQGLGLGTNLSPEDQRNAQQAAREAWSARGLVNSNGAIGAEILNRDALGRQRLAERQGLAQNVDATGFAQRQAGVGNMFQNAQLQSQNAFNPFNTITSANTTNTGNNQNLFGQTAGFSSGSFGNQNVNNLANPFGQYPQDVYSSNFNAGNDRFIAAGNNAAGLAAGQNQSNGALAAAFARALGGYLGGVCWVARAVFGERDPRWMQFRDWLLTRAPGWFRWLYIRHGEKFAAWLKLHPWAKPPIRAFMESRISSMAVTNKMETI